MDLSTFITVLGYALTPVTGVVTWLFTRKKQRNDFLQNLQSSINLLAEENKKLMAEVIELRRENMHLRTEVEELNRKLENVKTITKKI
jgi:predicted RNase H-like nuclease (RuvC/YqgF family)